MLAQADGDARTEAVGLNEDGHQLLEIVDSGALRQIAQRFHAPLAGLELQTHHAKFFTDFRVRVFQFF